MTDTAAELVVDVTARESVTAVLQRLESQLGQTNSVAERLAGSMEARLGASQAKAGRDTLAHAQAQARLQAVSGDTAGAIRTLQSALEGVDRSSVAAIRAETQLVQAQHKLTKELSGTNQFADAFKQGLFGFVAPAAAAGLALDALRATAQSFVDAFAVKANLDATTASIKSQLDGFRDADATYSQAIAFGRQYNITQQETNAILSSSTDILRTSRAGVGELETALIRLQSRDVSKPISEASRALRELASGDVTSIKELFNVPAKDALRMRDEIVAGGDAVKVLTAYLDGAQIGMTALAQRTQGAAGGMKELALAQEDLALAQAAFAQGPGLIILEGQIRTTTGLTRVLTGDFAAMTQSFADTSDGAAQAAFAWLNALAGVVPAQHAAIDANAAWTASGGPMIAVESAMTDIEAQRAAQLAATTAAQAAATEAALTHAAALDQDAATSALASVQSETLAIRKQQLATQAQAAAQAVLAGGGNIQATAARLASSSSLIDQLTAAYIRLSQAQAAAGAAAALADQRAGERNPGASGAAEAAAQEQRRLQQLYRRLANPPAKAPGGGGGGGASRRSGQQALNNQLRADQDKANAKFEDAETDHAKKLLAIQADYAKRRLAAEESLGQSLLEGGASFYDTLINMENQGAARAADAQYQAFLANELPQIAAEKGADVAEAYQDAYEKVLLDRAKRQAEIEKAQREGDTGRAEALRGVDAKYRAAEDAKLAKIKEGNDSIAAERDRALAEEGTRYDEANGKIADSADRAAARRILAAERAGQAIDAEQARLDRLAATYDRIAPARGPAGSAGTSAGQPTAAAPSVPSTATDVAPAGSAMLTALDSIRAAVDAAAEKISRAEGETTRAVKAGAQRGGVAG